MFRIQAIGKGKHQPVAESLIWGCQKEDIMDEKIFIPEKPKGALGIFFWWLKKLFFIGARTICPRCEKGEMFDGFFAIKKRCPHCNVKFQPYQGDELGVIAVGYFLTLAPTLPTLVFLHLNTDMTAYQLLATFLIMMTAILIGFYRNMKGIWVAFVFLLTGLRRKL